MFYSSKSSKLLLCIDSTYNRELSGRIYHPCMASPLRFDCIIELLSSITQILDFIKFPLPEVTLRTFSGKPKRVHGHCRKEVVNAMNEDIFNEESGKKATFIVQVQFQQNATWQGVLCWTDKKKTVNFRSALELLTLMNEAVKNDDMSAEDFI